MTTTETTETNSEFYQIRIPKALVKKVVVVGTATAAVVAAVFVARNLNVETDENSVTVELTSEES